MPRQKPFRNIQEVRDDIGRYGARTISFAGNVYLCMPLMLSLLSAILEELRRRPMRRQPSAYNLHVAREIKRGKTFQEAVESWRGRNER